MSDPEVIDGGCERCKQEINSDRSLGRAIGFRYHDGEPSLIEGLLARGDRRVGAVIRAVWEQGARFDGWSEHFSYERWVDAAAAVLPGIGVDLDWFTTREREQTRCCPGTTWTRAWTRTGSGRTGRTPSTGTSQDDCRWTPCFDCGVCPPGHRHPDRAHRAVSCCPSRRSTPACAVPAEA